MSGARATRAALVCVAGWLVGCGAPESAVASLGVARAALGGDPPVATAPTPAEGAAGVADDAPLCVTVAGPEGAPLTVRFQGRPDGAVAPDFTLVVLPDTQFLAARAPAVFQRQTAWIGANRVERGIAFVTHVGDIVNTAAVPEEWDAAEAALALIEDPALTGLGDGIPYGLAVGNHDQTPWGSPRTGTDERATTTDYEGRFGFSRFAGRSYFGGRYDFGDAAAYADSMDNHYELFSAGGLDFVALHLEFELSDSATRQAVLQWADDVARRHGDRHVLVTSHYLLVPGAPDAATHSNQGAALYAQLGDNPNVFLFLSGHRDGGGRRTDTAGGHPLHSVVQDYQSHGSETEGWLRLYTFSPAAGTIHVETFGTEHAVYETGDSHDFTLPWAMDAGGPWEDVATVEGAAAGERVCVPWPGRERGAAYDWRVTVFDGSERSSGAVWTFVAGCRTAADCDDGDPCTADACDAGACGREAVAGCCRADADCDDGDPCTDDACDPAEGCTYEPNTAPCDDGDACTLGDACAAGACAAGAPRACDDGDPCTDDACDPAEGCTHAPNTAPCDDGDACTLGDACAAGACAAGAPRACDDGDPCTADACDPAAGCAHAPNAAPCDDGDACTVGDACGDGTCRGDPVTGCCAAAADCDEPRELCVLPEGRCAPVACRACGADEDCGAPGNRCLTFPSGGGCVVGCVPDAAQCPEGTACGAAGETWLCLPPTAECDCPPGAGRACADGDVVLVDGCGGIEGVAEDCLGRGCVAGACCPPGKAERAGACEDEPPVEPPPDVAAPDAGGADVPDAGAAADAAGADAAAPTDAAAADAGGSADPDAAAGADGGPAAVDAAPGVEAAGPAAGDAGSAGADARADATAGLDGPPARDAAAADPDGFGAGAGSSGCATAPAGDAPWALAFLLLILLAVRRRADGAGPDGDRRIPGAARSRR